MEAGCGLPITLRAAQVFVLLCPPDSRQRDEPRRLIFSWSAARLFHVATGWSHMAAVNLIGSYNYALVALSVLIAMFASYAALDLAGRVTATVGWHRAGWVLGRAGGLGTGLWVMDYFWIVAVLI